MGGTVERGDRVAVGALAVVGEQERAQRLAELDDPLAAGLVVDTDRLRSNLDATSGALFSQRALTGLVESGLARDEAYRTVQAAAQEAFDSGTPFRDLIGTAAPDLDLDLVFDYDAYLTHLPEVFERLEALRS